MESRTIAVSVLIIALVVGGAGAVTFSGVLAQTNDAPYGKAISFVAFCGVEDVDQGDVTINSVMEDADGEAVAVNYTVSTGLDNLTYKAGTEIRDVHNPPSSGTVTTGDGILNNALSPQNPCPTGQSGVKYGNYDNVTGEFQQIEEV